MQGTTNRKTRKNAVRFHAATITKNQTSRIHHWKEKPQKAKEKITSKTKTKKDETTQKTWRSLRQFKRLIGTQSQLRSLKRQQWSVESIKSW